MRNCAVMWETEAVKLLTDEQCRMRGVKVRRSDGLLHDVLGSNVMLACGGLEGNLEMLAKYIGNRTVDLLLIAPGFVHNKDTGMKVALEVGAGTAGSFDGMHCEVVDTQAGKADTVIWAITMALLSTLTANISISKVKDISATFEMIAVETWRDQNQRAYFVTDKTIMISSDQIGCDTTDKEH